MVVKLIEGGAAMVAGGGGSTSLYAVGAPGFESAPLLATPRLDFWLKEASLDERQTLLSETCGRVHSLIPSHPWPGYKGHTSGGKDKTTLSVRVTPLFGTILPKTWQNALRIAVETT